MVAPAKSVELVEQGSKEDKYVASRGSGPTRSDPSSTDLSSMSRPKVDNYCEHEWSFEELNRNLECKLDLTNPSQSQGLSPSEAAAYVSLPAVSWPRPFPEAY
jgi:hypothetical protein